MIIFLHGLGRLTRSGIDALPSFPGSSTFPSSSRFVVEGEFRESGIVRSFEVVDHPVLFVFESHVLYSRDIQFFPYVFASYFIQPCLSRKLLRKRISAASRRVTPLFVVTRVWLPKF